MRRIVILIGLASMLFSSCTRRDTACDADKFFCTDPNTWEQSASRMSTKRLMRLYAIDWYYGRPPSGIFAVIMGSRGNETLKELAIYMNDHPETRTKSFYRPVISEVAFSSHVLACQSQFRQDLQASIGKVRETTC